VGAQDREPDRVTSPAEELDFGSRRPARRTGGQGALITVLVVVVAALAIRAEQSPHSRQPSLPSASTSAMPTSPAPVISRGPARAAPPLELPLGDRLLGIKAGWELFGRGPHEVVRIQFAKRVVTRTSVPPLLSTGPVSFVVGPQGAIVRPLDMVPGYLVPDGHFARALPGALRRGGLALPGPKLGQVWVQTGDLRRPTMSLIDSRGQPTGVTVHLPSSQQLVSSDGRGYLLVTRASGVYDARPDGLRRVTTGQLLAVGPTRWLTIRCVRHRQCVEVVIDRARGTRHVLGQPVDRDLREPVGLISPDGAVAALPRTHSSGRVTLRLLDLASGMDREYAISLSAQGMFGSEVAWSPDSRWLFVVTASGRLLAVDAHTGIAHQLGVALPQLSQLVVRSAAASA
jgi:hypothetical protein